MPYSKNRANLRRYKDRRRKSSCRSFKSRIS